MPQREFLREKKGFDRRKTSASARARSADDSPKKRASERFNVSDLSKRIETMHRRDIAVAVAFILGLWFAIIFVAIETWSLAPTPAARIMLLAGGAVVLLFNSAAIMAMLRHYREDRDFMYGLDIKFLDEAREAKKGLREAKNGLRHA